MLRSFFLKGRICRRLLKVLRHSLEENGKVIGAFNDHPLLNTLVYDVEFPDGANKEYAANIIAESVLSQVYPNGFYTNVV